MKKQRKEIIDTHIIPLVILLNRKLQYLKQIVPEFNCVRPKNYEDVRPLTITESDNSICI